MSLPPIRLVYLPYEPEKTGMLCNQVLFIVPKRNVKRAVDRNAIKRRMREAYRLNKRLLSHGATYFLLAYIYVSSQVRSDFKIIQDQIVKGLGHIQKKQMSALEKTYERRGDDKTKMLDGLNT